MSQPNQQSPQNPLPHKMVKLTIDGTAVEVAEKTTLYAAARAVYKEDDLRKQIPVLCHQDDKKPVGVCRMCMVEIHQEDKDKHQDKYKGKPFAAACVREVEAGDEGLEVTTKSSGVEQIRKTLLELLMADHHAPCIRQQEHRDCELEALAKTYGAQDSPYPHRSVARGRDTSSHIILVDHSACILCDRCIRGCAEIRGNNIIARQGKGYSSAIAFGLGAPMDTSGCVSCGECMVSCPTGALTKVDVEDANCSASADLKEIKELPIFTHVSSAFFDFCESSIQKKTYKAGEYFFEEGDPAASAFYIMEGKVDIFIKSRMAQIKTQRAPGAAFKMASRLASFEEQARAGEGPRRTHIPVDASRELPYGNPIGTLEPGHLFGEMSCLSSYPRSATARAATDCTVLEMRRNVLDMLMKNEYFKKKVEEEYLEHAFKHHLRSFEMFENLTPAFVNELRKKVKLLRYAPGEIIYKQGELAEGFYLVRRGFVKVSECYPDGELVLAYKPPGSYFGEISLLGEGRHTATCSALDHVDLVCIDANDFKMLKDFPTIGEDGKRSSIGEDLKKISAKLLLENQKRFSAVHEMSVHEFVRQGLLEAHSLLLLDLKKCTRCDQCVKACADAHDGVTRLVRDGLRYDHYLVATSCRHCRDPLCMVCPVGAITRGKSLEITIDHSCIGCGECAKRCPYGNINMQLVEASTDELAELGKGQQRAKKVLKATSCNLCQGEKEPACVYACPHDAAHRIDPDKFFKIEEMKAK